MVSDERNMNENRPLLMYSLCYLRAELENAELAREMFETLRNLICNKFCNNTDTVTYCIIRVSVDINVLNETMIEIS